MTTLLREELVEHSVMQTITDGLPGYGYVLETATSDPANANLAVREAFPTPEERESELTITTLAFGFNIDDGGKPMELGSSLTEYTHTLMCWVFATEPRFGRRVAHTIKHVMRANNDAIPLLDYNQDGDPQIDTLRIDKVQVQHQANNSVRPWDQYVWTVAINAQDIFFP